MIAAPSPNPARARPAWSWRRIPWAGGLFVVVIAATAGHDIYRGYRVAISETGRELGSNARVIAEQTARSLQTVERVLAHVVEQVRSGALATKNPRELHEYVRDQSVGLVQIEGLSLFDATGTARAISFAFPVPDRVPSVAEHPLFRQFARSPDSGLVIGDTAPAVVNPGRWVFPIARRLETATGEFAGAIAAGGRVDYFQQFYRDVRLDEGTTITLMHRNGTLMARHPPVEAALGKRYDLFDAMRVLRDADPAAPLRAISPVDGVERFAALEMVPDYPLAVVVTRDASVALAGWRHQALGNVARTLALVVLAVGLLALLRRQFTRLDKTRESLEVSRERFALAAAGADVGIWDWQVAGDRIYASTRAREIFGTGPGPESVPRTEWFAAAQIHPDDAAARSEAIRAHLAGETPVYEGEYRVRDAGGEYRWIRVRGLCVRNAAGEPLRMAGSVADVDARRSAEQALRLSEQRFALAVAGSNDGILDWDVVNDRMYTSERALRISGVEGSETVHTRAQWRALLKIHPDDVQRHENDLREYYEGHSTVRHGEYRVLHPDGQYRWVRVRMLCVRDAAGNATRFSGSVSDIDAYKRTEAALRETQERYALAVAGSDDGVWDFDYVENRAFGSRRCRELIGMPLEPEVQTLEEWFASVRLHPDDMPLRRESMQAHLAGKTPAYEGEWRALQPDGSYRWVRVRGMCVRDATGKPLRMAGSVSDIDSRKRVEAALRESEERYALAMTGSNEGHWVWDIERDQAYASAHMNRILGLPAQAYQASYSDYFARIPMHPEDRPRVVRAREAHLTGNAERLDVEYRIVIPGSGEVRWIQARGQCFRNAEGKPVKLAGSIEDITERKRTEERLRRSEERYALAVAGSDDGVWDWDFVAGVAFESARARELQGLPPGAESQPLPDLLDSLRVHPDDAPRRAEGIRAHLAGETPAYECDYRVRHEDGRYRWIHVRALCIRDASGKAVRMAGSVSDVDALKIAEAALRRSEERYQLAVDGSNEGLWDWDLASDSLFLSPRAQELLWLDPGEPQRARREWIDLTHYHPDDVRIVRDAISAHLHGQTSHFKVEYRLRHHSGGWRWYRQRGVAIRDAQGRPTRMAGSMEDITERKATEAERERLEVQLRQAQKLEAIGTLAGGIAHDFNNILAAILGYGEMAQKDAAEGSALRRHIDAALSAAMRAKSLVERILAFSRSGMGERVPVHVQSVVGEALDAVAASLPPGITLVRQLAAGDSAVLGDPTQVHQVVMNLCANAVQAMKATGTLTVTLEAVELHEPRCATNMLADGSYIGLSVRDTGAGIAPNLLERIFDPFFTTKEIGVGTGLGLSLVHGIVTDLGGGVCVESRVGAGSNFTVYLPWSSCVTAPVPLDEASAPPNGNGETILLVDDEEPLVRLGEELIAELGYEPVGFTSSRAALATFRAEPQRFNAVLSDEAMPEMTGSEMVVEIRKIRPDIPIVLMSGYVTAALASRARDAGVAEVLNKPLVGSDIARSLADALRR